MRGGDPEPNEHYRPWLEEHVGDQGFEWQWYVDNVSGDDGLAIEFRYSEHAMLFELTWA